MNISQKEFQVRTVQSQSLSGSAVLNMIKSGVEGEAFEFIGCTLGQIDLSGLKLPPLKFVDCKFENSACFANSVFNNAHPELGLVQQLEEATFREQWFSASGRAVWKDAPATWCLWIDSCTFDCDLDIRSSAFDGVLWIANNEFCSVWATNSRFQDTIRFMGNKFARDLSLASSLENKDQCQIFRSNFRMNEVHGTLSLKNRCLNGPTDFRGSKFYLAPDMEGSEVSSDTNWLGVTFHDVLQPRAEHSYRIIRKALQGKSSRQFIGYTFLFEHRAKRANGSMPAFLAFVSLMYDLGSLYGFSIIRPITLLILLFITLPLILGSVFDLSTDNIDNILNFANPFVEKLFNPLSALTPDSFKNVIFDGGLSVVDQTILYFANGVSTAVQVILLGLVVQALGIFFSYKI